MVSRYGHPARVALVAVLVLSAGCAGLFGDAGNEETLTPAPIPTTQPAPAPGVAGDGEIDSTQLVAANDRRLNGTSYQFDRTVRVDGPNSGLVIDRVRRVRANGTGIERLSVNGTGVLTPAIRNWTVWSNGEAVWRRANLTDGRTVSNRLPTDEDGPFDAGRELAVATFVAGEFRIGPRNPGEFVLESTGPFNLTDRIAPSVVGPPENATARAVVTDRGVIRNLTVTYQGTFDGERVRVRVSQRVTGLDDTTATRPAWVPGKNESVAEPSSRVASASTGHGSTDRGSAAELSGQLYRESSIGPEQPTGRMGTDPTSLVEDVMSTPLETISAEATVKAAAERMREDDISALFVPGPEAGIVTKTDIVDTVAAGVDPADVRVADVMTAPIERVTTGVDLNEAAAMMTTYGIKHLPVSDSHGDYVGMLSSTDLTTELA